MAENRKKASWSLTDGLLAVTMPEGAEGSWNLVELFPDFLTMTDCQQQAIGYGIKQKLSDSTARSKDEKLTEEEAIAQMGETYQMVVDGKWTSGRKGGAGGGLGKKAVDSAWEKASLAEQKVLIKLGMAPKGITEPTKTK